MSRVFTDMLSNSPKCSLLFSPGYEAMEKMFSFINHVTGGIADRVSEISYIVCTYEYCVQNAASVGSEKI